MDPRDVSGGAVGGRGCPVSGLAPPRAPRSPCCRVGRFGEQSAGEILPAHRTWPPPPERDYRLVAAHQHRHQPRPRSNLTEEDMAEWLTGLRLRLRALVRRRRHDDEVRDELDFHLAMRAEAL